MTAVITPTYAQITSLLFLLLLLLLLLYYVCNKEVICAYVGVITAV
jgi:hypothetical protein